MYDDAKFIGDFITHVLDNDNTAGAGEDVVILAHSYGACPATQCLKNLTKNERMAAGKKGGVVRIAYLTAVVPKVGDNTVQTVTAFPSTGASPPAVDVDEFGWMKQIDPEQTGSKMVFNSLSSEEAIARSKSFGRHAGPAFLDPLTYAGYQDVGLSSLVSSQEDFVRRGRRDFMLTRFSLILAAR